MAKKKKSRRQGLFSKALNVGLIALGFSRVLGILFTGASAGDKANQIIRESTFGLSEGSFDLNAGLLMYTPVAGAFALGTLKQFLMKKFPVRR